MNKLIGIICFFHVLVSCIHAAEEPKEQKEKMVSNMVIWGLNNPLAPIPIRKQIATGNQTTTHWSLASFFKSKKTAPPVSNIILLICKANDTQAFITAFNDHRFRPFHEAYSARDDNGNTPLHIACKKKNADIVELLLKNIHNIDVQNKKGKTPLHIACEKNSESIVKLLCLNSNRIDFSQIDKQEFTPFQITCMHNYTALTALLLAEFERLSAHFRLENITKLNRFKLLPIHLACINNNIETMELLLNNPHVDPNSVQEDGSWTTPLHFAVQMRFYKIMLLLLNHDRINPSAQDRKEYIIYTPMPDSTINIQYNYQFHNTPLHVACNNNDAAAVALLLRHRRILPKAKNSDDKTAYDIAYDNQNIKIMNLLEKYR